MQVTESVNKVYQEALKAQENAYAPYSNFKVGAAVKLRDKDEIVSGCNVENASYGATVCAERGAVQTAISSFGKVDFEFIVVVSSTDPAIGPCALCLQVLSEFCSHDLVIYFANRDKVQSSHKLSELLPRPFSEIPETI